MREGEKSKEEEKEDLLSYHYSIVSVFSSALSRISYSNLKHNGECDEKKKIGVCFINGMTTMIKKSKRGWM